MAKLHLPGFRKKLQTTGVTGRIDIHDAKLNVGSVKKLLKQDPYVTFGIAEVHAAIRRHKYDFDSLVGIMAASLGTSPERYLQDGPAYIDPALTLDRLEQMLNRIDQAIKKDQLIVLATSHPGSMLAFYAALASYITKHRGRLYVTPAPFSTDPYRFIDVVSGVHVMSDQGSLYHIHESEGFWHFLGQLPEAPGLVVADHGFAGAAINRDISTVGIHDVDDGGIPVAAELGLDVLAVPMNDNQLNIPTLAALETALAARQ